MAVGVVELKSLSGVAASSYMWLVAESKDKGRSRSDVNKIMREMAGHYLEKARNRLIIGVVEREVDHKAASAFHSRTFSDNGLPDEALALYPVFEMLPEEGGNIGKMFWTLLAILIDSMAAFAPQAQPGFLPMDDGHRGMAAMIAVGA